MHCYLSHNTWIMLILLNSRFCVQPSFSFILHLQHKRPWDGNNSLFMSTPTIVECLLYGNIWKGIMWSLRPFHIHKNNKLKTEIYGLEIWLGKKTFSKLWHFSFLWHHPAEKQNEHKKPKRKKEWVLQKRLFLREMT